jgi:multicomponent Na+:H+ antiporter subunit C
VTFVLAICVAVIFGVSLYMMLGRELKGVAMGVFLLSHAANLCILAQSGSPVIGPDEMKRPPVLSEEVIAGVSDRQPMLSVVVDPLPQALILTAIVISFAVMGFLLTLIIVTGRKTGTLDLNRLAKEGRSTPSQAH